MNKFWRGFVGPTGVQRGRILDLWHSGVFSVFWVNNQDL